VFNISGNFRSEQRFFTKKNPFYTETLRCFTHFFVQNEQSRELLNSIGLENVTVSGDTRYDRVAANAALAKPSQVLTDFKQKELVLILGSSWYADHQLIIPKINDGTIQEKVIIAPHEINEKSNNAILDQLSVKAFRYSCNDDVVSFAQKRVAVLDCMGYLANAYSLGSYAYVGGAFGRGLHNILEPAVFGLPVIFGPHYSKFPEAKEFIDAEIGFSISNQEEFLKCRAYILENLPELQIKVKAFMEAKVGATDLIMSVLLNEGV
jgi:3-deoxy-D-manno-octulosonic-acid transferase